MLPAGTEGLQRAFELTWFWAIALTWFHSIYLSFTIFCILSPKICCSLPLNLFPFVIIAMSFLQCDQTTSIVLYVRGIISNSILVVWFLILLLVWCWFYIVHSTQQIRLLTIKQTNYFHTQSIYDTYTWFSLLHVLAVNHHHMGVTPKIYAV
jgi:hypothetical protein